jgi:hypothetical protein
MTIRSFGLAAVPFETLQKLYHLKQHRHTCVGRFTLHLSARNRVTIVIKVEIKGIIRVAQVMHSRVQVPIR